jgi:hypothetical protein
MRERLLEKEGFADKYAEALVFTMGKPKPRYGL